MIDALNGLLNLANDAAAQISGLFDQVKSTVTADENNKALALASLATATEANTQAIVEVVAATDNLGQAITIINENNPDGPDSGVTALIALAASDGDAALNKCVEATEEIATARLLLKTAGFTPTTSGGTTNKNNNLIWYAAAAALALMVIK
jgi:hypothetical protein